MSQIQLSHLILDTFEKSRKIVAFLECYLALLVDHYTNQQSVGSGVHLPSMAAD